MQEHTYNNLSFMGSIPTGSELPTTVISPEISGAIEEINQKETSVDYVEKEEFLEHEENVERYCYVYIFFNQSTYDLQHNLSLK